MNLTATQLRIQSKRSLLRREAGHVQANRMINSTSAPLPSPEDALCRSRISRVKLLELPPEFGCKQKKLAQERWALLDVVSC